MKTAFVAAAAIGILMSSAASAADAGVWRDWNGLYIGGNLGYGWGSVGLANVMSGYPTPSGPGTYDSSFNPAGAVAGGEVGFNYVFDDTLVGVEADMQWSGMADTSSLGDDAKLDYFGTVRVRLGKTIGSYLAYVTGGFAFGHGTGTLNYVSPVAATFTDDAAHIGWTLGVGVEKAIDEHLSLKAEYLYVKLNSEFYNWGYAVADVDYSFNVLRAGLNYRF